MKRIICIIIALAAMTAYGNAQFFVEGSVRVINNPSRFYFNASPLAGYQLNDKIAAGAKASLVKGKEKFPKIDPDTGDEVKSEYRDTEWSAAVFCRYQLLSSKKIKNLSFLVESSFYVNEKNESVSTIGINLLPLVTYNLSAKFSIIATGEFLRLGFYSLTEKRGTTIVIKEKGLKFGTETTLFRSLGSIKLGFIYHF